MKVLDVHNISKQYRLGQIGTGTLSHDLNRWWFKIIGKKDPYLKIGELNDRTKNGGSEYVWALKDISFSVNKGEVLGIIGKNGAGKSTLLKILSRVTAPTTGNVKLKGRMASLLEVGTGFHPELTGKENIFLNGAILGMTKQEISEKLNEIVKFAGIEKYLDTPIKRYSSGMTVRLGFAVAAHLEPEILVVDEVLAVGDAEFQKKAVGKMKDVSSTDGRTILFVSHNMASIASLCNRVIVMENGLIVFDGDTKKGIEAYMESNFVGNIDKPLSAFRTVKVDKVEFKSLEVGNPEYQKDKSIFYKEPISIKGDYKVHSIIKDVFFDLRIMTMDGIEMIHTSNIYDSDFITRDKGTYRFSIDIENPLQPGSYYLTFGIHQSDGRTLEYLEQVFNINVLSVSSDNRFNYNFNFSMGYLRLKSSWAL